MTTRTKKRRPAQPRRSRVCLPGFKQQLCLLYRQLQTAHESAKVLEQIEPSWEERYADDEFDDCILDIQDELLHAKEQVFRWMDTILSQERVARQIHNGEPKP